MKVQSILRFAAVLSSGSLAFSVSAQCDWTQRFIEEPNPTAIIYGMEGAFSGDIFAVGALNNGDWNPYAATFDGTDWTPSPIDNDAADGFLNDVVIPASGAPLAVGLIAPGVTPARPLLLEWNGQMWERIDAPDSNGEGGFLAAGHAGSDVWISGFRENPDTPPAASGIGWAGRRTSNGSFQMYDLPLLAETGARSRNDVRGISGATPDDVWAVGFGRENGTGGFPDRVMIQHFDGSDWTLLDIPAIGLQSMLNDVKAVAPDDVWAAGWFIAPSSLKQPLVMHYDGSSWSQIAVPVPTGHTSLHDLAVVSASEIYAVGTTQDQNQMQIPFIMHYDGSTWTIVSDLNPSGVAHWFRAAAVANGKPHAAGQFSPEPFVTDPFVMTLDCNTCIADINDDGLLTPADFSAWIAAFNAGAPKCDQNGDATCTPADFTAWLANYNAGR